MPYIINGEKEGVNLPPFANFFQKIFENMEKNILENNIKVNEYGEHKDKGNNIIGK